jgi:TatA/E family protein of Tat protein translocase
MGLDNPLHLAFLLILLLLVFGARRLTEIGRSLASGMRGFRGALSGGGVPSTLSGANASNGVAALAAGHAHTHEADEQRPAA